MSVVFYPKKAEEAQSKIRSSMNLIKVFGIAILCTISCSGAVEEPATGITKSDRSDSGVTQYMGYPGQGYGLGYGGPEYGGYPSPPVAGLVPPYANGGGYLGSPPYTGYYPPYGELYPPQVPYPMIPPPMMPPPMYQPPIPYPGYPVMRPGIGYSQYSAKKRLDTKGLA